MERDKISMAYAAGLMDGDGSFSIRKLKTKANPQYFPLLQLQKHKMEMLDFLKEHFGGTIFIGKPRISKDGSEGKAVYRWRLRSNVNVKPMLEAIIPYLKTKKERAEFLLEFINSFTFERGIFLSSEKLADRERSYLNMMHLNSAKSFNNTVSSKLAKINSVDPLFWAYMAGLMDTDGSFSIKRQTQNKGTHVINARYLPVISLGMVDVTAINYLRQNFNLGKLYIPKNSSTSNGFHYQFGIYTKIECVEFLNNLIPFLRSKKMAAEQLLEFCKNSQNTRYCKAGISAEELEYREKSYQNLIHINKYGVFKS